MGHISSWSTQMGTNIHTKREPTEAFLVLWRNVGLEVNAEKTNCMFISREQKTGQIHDFHTATRSSDV